MENDNKTFFLRKLAEGTFKNKTHVISYRDAEGKMWGVPEDEGNSDYQEYLRWVAKGNTAVEETI